jgi:hypothetical protein
MGRRVFQKPFVFQNTQNWRSCRFWYTHPTLGTWVNRERVQPLHPLRIVWDRGYRADFATGSENYTASRIPTSEKTKSTYFVE